MSNKRSSSDDLDVSVVTPKRKMLQTTLTSSTAKPEVDCWRISSSLLIYTHPDCIPSSKILALDMDGTIITTASGRTFPKDCNDWKYCLIMRKKLEEYHCKSYKLVIMSNQSGVTKGHQDVSSFQIKVENIVSKIGLPLQCFYSILPDRNRKPLTGMWAELETGCNGGVPISKKDSLYCGDAAGRPAEGSRRKDHSCVDRLFALNLGLPFLTPEELWFGQNGTGNFSLPAFNPNTLLQHVQPELPLFTQPAKTELIVMVGYPASGKSYFCRTVLAPLGYRIVSRDILGTWQKCVKSCSDSLSEGVSVVVDNTNLDVESRSRYIKVGREVNVPVRCFMMQTDVDHSRHNERFRYLTDPAHPHVNQMAFNMLKSKYTPPALKEGFTELLSIPFILDRNHKDISLYCMHLLER
ncbi:unnamed protein product [Dicrocoelium dendriticum]|nr:unnamed protein product [Dicrocoelium dendriticum]